MHILNMRCTFLPIVTIFLPVIWAWGLIKVVTTVFTDSLLSFPPHCFSRFVTGYFWRNYVWEVVESVPGWGGILLLTVGKLKTKSSLHPEDLDIHKGNRQRKSFYYWINIMPECNVHHRKSTQRFQRKKINLTLHITKHTPPITNTCSWRVW